MDTRSHRPTAILAGLAALILLVPAAPAGAQASPHMVRDINPSGSSNPKEFVAREDKVFFPASDGAHGAELWRSDGTAGGTRMVKDIRPGGGSSSPSAMVNIGGTLYFSADDGVHGRELWKSDGTGAGTRLVKDIRSGRQGSNPRDMTRLGGRILLSANAGAGGRELWRTDGTAGGTKLVKDLNPSGGSGPHDFVAMGGRVYLLANPANHGPRLFRTDGTAAGTKRLTTSPGWAWELVRVGSRLFYLADFSSSTGVAWRELWRSDGTAAGTKSMMEIYAWDLTAAGSRLSFVAPGDQDYPRVWLSDGTVAGTQPIRPKLGDSDIEGLTAIGSTLFYTTHREERLFWYAGPSQGHKEIGIDAEIAASYQGDGTVFVQARGPEFQVFFSAGYWSPDTGNGSVLQYELWRTDGTSAGTVQVGVINEQGGSARPKWLTAAGDWDAIGGSSQSLYFSANDGIHGRELWVHEP